MTKQQHRKQQQQHITRAVGYEPSGSSLHRPTVVVDLILAQDTRDQEGGEAVWFWPHRSIPVAPSELASCNPKHESIKRRRAPPFGCPHGRRGAGNKLAFLIIGNVYVRNNNGGGSSGSDGKCGPQGRGASRSVRMRSVALCVELV